MKKSVIAILSIIMLQMACSKQQEEIAGTIKDYTGLDGCGLVIVLNNGVALEPFKLPAGTHLVAGKKVMIKYKTLHDRFSICMAGPIVEITSLRYL